MKKRQRIITVVLIVIIGAVITAAVTKTYPIKALSEHREKLRRKREQIDMLITNVEKTIAQAERRIIMTDQEKFEGFKQKMIDDNEQKIWQRDQGKIW